MFTVGQPIFFKMRKKGRFLPAVVTEVDSENEFVWGTVMDENGKPLAILGGKFADVLTHMPGENL
jgi:hypothetical protein